eukprot:282319-Chlamydomonas_euryale.AAC.3
MPARLATSTYCGRLPPPNAHTSTLICARLHSAAYRTQKPSSGRRSGGSLSVPYALGLSRACTGTHGVVPRSDAFLCAKQNLSARHPRLSRACTRAHGNARDDVRVVPCLYVPRAVVFPCVAAAWSALDPGLGLINSALCNDGDLQKMSNLFHQ